MWDMESLRKIAGLQESYEFEHLYEPTTALYEAWDDEDDDEDDEDVKKMDKEAKKLGVKLPKADVDVDKDIHDLAVKRSAKSSDQPVRKPQVGGVGGYAAQMLKNQQARQAAEKQSTEKAAETKVKAEPRVPKEPSEVGDSSGPKKRGKAVDPNSKTQKLKAWMDENPGAKRKEAWIYAEKELAFTKAGFSTIYQGLKGKRIKECYVLRHPTIPSFILSENGAMNQYQWISDSDIETPLNPMIFESKQAAAEVINYLQSFKNQTVELKWVDLR